MNVAELQIEISELYKQANIDQDRELINELNIISQVLSNNKSNSSSTDFKNKFTYNNTDQGPYFVYIEGKNGNIGNIHPLKLGKYLFENNKGNLKIKSIKRKGKNRVGVEFETANEANLFSKEVQF
ncbi:hypothetical protein WA026_023483 [Henosepilachna vigintioctopunctata]|uniref:Uncharacterized protein n=1 Tax=Henosepilachna vigintioctopunctata TaxID=420089 RepID=A0AAW1V600_9CUCU